MVHQGVGAVELAGVGEDEVDVCNKGVQRGIAVGVDAPADGAEVHGRVHHGTVVGVLVGVDGHVEDVAKGALHHGVEEAAAVALHEIRHATPVRLLQRRAVAL